MIDNLKRLLNEDQNPKDVEKILSKVQDLLTSGEEVQYIAVQKKPVANLSPDSIALTNKRIIFCRPKNLGLSMSFEDYLWKEIADCHIKEGIMGSEFTTKTTKGHITKLDYLSKSQARKLYQFAQAKEEEMQEYRRQRELEDKRAAAGGGITVNTNIPNSSVNNDLPKEDLVETLQKLKKLLDANIISEEEFNAKKAELLSKL